MVSSVTEQLLGSLVTSSQQPTVFQLVSSLVLHTVTELSLASQDTVLVEAWVTHPQDKSKRRKTVEESLPVLSSQVATIKMITTMFMTIIIHQGSPDTLTTLFQQAAAAWSLLTSQSTMEAQFQVKLFIQI